MLVKYVDIVSVVSRYSGTQSGVIIVDQTLMFDNIRLSATKNCRILYLVRDYKACGYKSHQMKEREVDPTAIGRSSK